MAVGGAEVLGGAAATAAGSATVVGAGVGSLVVYDGVDTAWNGFQETRADHRAPLGQGVLQSLNPDNPVSVQDQVLQQRLEQAGLTSENMIVAGAVAVGGAAVRGAEKAFTPVARAIGRTADDILASAPVQAMGNSARKLAGDIGEKAGRAIDRVAEKVGLGSPKLATAGGVNPNALTRTTPDTPAANAFLREGPNTPATPDVAAIRNRSNQQSLVIEKRPDFYVRPSGDAIPGTGYRAIGGKSNLAEIATGKIASRDPTYITFNDIREKSAAEVQDLLQLPQKPSHMVEFDTKQILDSLRIPGGRWNTEKNPEPLTKKFPEWGKGGGTQAITDQEIKIDPKLVTEFPQ